MSADTGGRAPRKPSIGLVVAATAAFAILIALGTWQLERKVWKEGLIAAIETRAFGPPAEIAGEKDWAGSSPTTAEYAHLKLTGTFAHEQEVAVHGIAEGGRGQGLLGYYVFTPLVLSDGSTIVVNRGFVPAELRAASTRSAGNEPGPATVTGLARVPETRSMFVPANDPGRDEWFVRNITDMAAARGLRRVAPFYVDADATPNPGGWPKGGQTRLALPNDHLGYALTWFGLAAALVGVFAAYALRGRRTDTVNGDADAAPVLQTGSERADPR